MTVIKPQAPGWVPPKSPRRKAVRVTFTPAEFLVVQAAAAKKHQPITAYLADAVLAIVEAEKSGGKRE